MTTGNQLEMNLATGENSFKKNLDNGVFTVLIEHDSPGSDVAPEASGARLCRLDEAVAEVTQLPMALAITDKYGFENTHRAVEYAGALPPHRRNSHLIYLSGRGTSKEQMQEMLQLCRNGGITNVVPVTGDLSAVAGEQYLEDVHTLKQIQEHYSDCFCAGAVVNPFKYRGDVQLAQLFKLIKKLRFGAEFVVTQMGWDMRKLQSLKWYLAYRGLEFPVIARLGLLTPASFEKICANKVAGVSVSPDFKVILRRELAFSAKQFEAAQWRRLELQVAGCKLLGFSGVQIAGIDSVEQIKQAEHRIKSALEEFDSFEAWTENYYSYQDRAEMAPTPDAFIMFNDLLKHQYYNSTVTFKHNSGKFGSVSKINQLLYWLKRELFSTPTASAGRKFLLQLLGGCRQCKNVNLSKTQYLCLHSCPKKLQNGPCGSVNLDGTCEKGHKNCVFNQLLVLAQWRGELDRLETEYISES